MTTDKNLKDAFAGESQANRKYLAFARRAELEGPPAPSPKPRRCTRWRT